MTYTWNHGQTGAELTQLAGGKYTVIAQDEAGCADTATVMVVRAPQVQVASTTGLCDGSTDMRIDIDSNSDTAVWNLKLNDAMGVEEFQLAGVALLATLVLNFILLPLMLKKRKRLKRVIKARKRNSAAAMDFDDFFE